VSGENPNVKMIFGNGFPFGGASTKRCLHIAKGLILNGVNVEVIIFRGTEKLERNENSEPKGEFEGVPFRFIHKNVFWPTGLISRVFNFYSGLIKALWSVALENRAKRVNAVLLAGYNGHIAGLLFASFCNRNNILSVLFSDEYPDFMLKQRTRFDSLSILLTFFTVRKFKVVAVISDALFNFWQSMIRNGQKVIKYPLTAENCEISAINKPYEFNYLFYSGFSSMRSGRNYLEKDEPEVLLKAFSIVARSHGDLRLIIAGQKSESLVESVKFLGLVDRVIFVGKVVESVYNQLIKQALAAILPRPKTIQTKGSIPYRLGEYLLAGRYVISSDVGEIKQIVEGDQTVLFYSPGDYLDLAKKIEFVLDFSSQKPGSFDRASIIEKMNIVSNACELAKMIKERSILP